MTILTETESVSVVNALRAASDQYYVDAQRCLEFGDSRTSQQFDRQAKEALRLAELMDGYLIRLEA